jgi:DNA-binding XRE family transcriptional regulator
MTTPLPQRLPRISRILGIEPFIITALWTTAEIRQNDFTPLFSQWKAENDTRLFPLFDFDTFKQVAISPAHTFHWPTVPVCIELARRTIEGVLDLDPDELYRQSTLVQRTEQLAIGSLLRKARQDAGLSQLDLATRSGTTRNYISRIENGKSDIQLETLNKIVQLGMGKQIRVEIA